MLKMVAGFFLEYPTSCVLIHPIYSRLTAKAAGQLLLSHTAAKTQGSPHTPPHTHPHTVNYTQRLVQKPLPVSAPIFHNMNRPIVVLQHVRCIAKPKRVYEDSCSKAQNQERFLAGHTHPLMAGNKYRGTTPMQSTRNHEAEQQPTRPGSIIVSRLNDRGGKNQRERSCDWDEKRKQISWR